MKIIEKNGNIIVQGLRDFNIGQTLECGQCFRFDKICEDDYILVAKGRILHIEQKEDDIIFYDTGLEDFNLIWKEYFDLNRDYGLIKKSLLKKDKVLQEAIHSKSGVHILNQDFFEMLITFIISQNKQIPHIKQIVELISNRYGEKIGEMCGKEYYSFPTVERLSKVSEEEFRDCKAGFRAPYLVNACRSVLEGRVTRDKLMNQSTEKVLEILTSIKGVGEKIANCVMLFGLSRSESFPVDVWIKRVMENLYFHEETKKDIIKEFAKEHFGEYAGFAQQYLFYYARDNKMKNVS
ncbi:N-glycosylase/DNA lyase [Mobilisporobacter senegalensis]|uniref:DNA-(apurinic or apyrimidinic site) lyase n=1 Tax=Mobilisporobacter senegalensis TaxID=1329262 RepID=A0A3N1XI23_9FIRM|nr:DNA glycosylase [Mobilisporobacter senegalensis]ROR26305.1 N-glycosylase/DNA lyase [Mobilisporobacter senegalensis]